MKLESVKDQWSEDESSTIFGLQPKQSQIADEDWIVTTPPTVKDEDSTITFM